MPFPELLKVVALLSIRADCGTVQKSLQKILRDTQSLVKLHVGGGKRMGRKKKKERSKTTSLTQPYFPKSEEIFWLCRSC